MSDVLLPGNATKQERDIEAVIAPRIEAIPAPIRTVWNPDTCPADILPWLAWAFSVDEWSPLLSEAQKRNLIKASIDVHRYKGTIGAVREALAALGFDSAVQEWNQQIPEGEPYTFKVQVKTDQTGFTYEQLQVLLGVVFKTKNLRSHLDAMKIFVRAEAGPRVGIVVGLGHEINLTGFLPPLVVLNETTIVLN